MCSFIVLEIWSLTAKYHKKLFDRSTCEKSNYIVEKLCHKIGTTIIIIQNVFGLLLLKKEEEEESWI